MYRTNGVVYQNANERSRFATALSRLLDDTKFLTREQWSRVLGVTTAAISQWVQDRTVPRPEVLRSIIGLLKSRTKIPRRFIEEFEQVTALPAAEVSPHGRRIAETTIHYKVGHTFGHYAVAPMLEAFLRNLSPLPPQKQEEVLTSASKRCLDMGLDVEAPTCNELTSEEEQVPQTASELAQICGQTG